MSILDAQERVPVPVLLRTNVEVEEDAARLAWIQALEATLGMGSQYWQFHAGRFVVGDLELRQIRRPDCRRCWPFELQKLVACEM